MMLRRAFGLWLCVAASAGLAQSPGADACGRPQQEGIALQELGRQAFVERRWPEAAMLYGKAGASWEQAVSSCEGGNRQSAMRRREQALIDGFNAEFCAPAFERPREFTQKFRGAFASLSAAERQQQSLMAETLWRHAAQQCAGSAQELANNNAQALARERRTPWVATPPPGPALAAKPSRPTPTLQTPAPSSTDVHVAGVPRDLDLRSGDTRYKGRFVREEGQVLTGAGRVEWANGDVYEGALLRNQRHGKGLFIWASGQRYQGDWLRDKATGQGKLKFANGNEFEGTVVDGQPEGEGELLYASGERYKGQIRRGVPQGRGLYQGINGNRYEGDWVQEQPQGRGEMRFANGNHYVGGFQAGLPHGRGRMVFGSGDVYEGGHANGVADGAGLYVWKSGDRYEGLWSAGRKQGRGVFQWANGDKWEGIFKNDEQTEDGALTRREDPRK